MMNFKTLIYNVSQFSIFYFIRFTKLKAMNLKIENERVIIQS